MASNTYKVAMHECAHWLVAVALGVRVERLRAQRVNGVLKGDCWVYPTSIHVHRLAVALAGEIASPSLRVSADDEREADEAIYRLRASGNSAIYGEIKARQLARQIIVKNNAVLMRAARRLVRYGELNAADLSDLATLIKRVKP